MRRLLGKHRFSSAALAGLASVTCLEELEKRVLFATVVVNAVADVLYPPTLGLVSLRNAAVMASSSTTPTTITFDPQVFATPQTIILNGSPLLVSNPHTGAVITIIGPAAGLTVSGNNASGVFRLSGTTMSGLTVTGGMADPGSGGAITCSGSVSLSDVTVTANPGIGIYSFLSPLSLDRVTVTNNTNSGVFCGGPLTMTNSTVSGNARTSGDGGGLYLGGTATMTDVTVSNNTASDGGGMFVYGNATLRNVTVSGNTAGRPGSRGVGGGIFINPATHQEFSDVTISGNTAAADGGGLAYTGSSNETLTLNNVTIAGNVATSGRGGGIYTALGHLGLTNTTISGNHANQGGGIFSTAIALNTTVANTIVAGNSISGATGPDAAGAFSSFFGNLVGKTDGSTGWAPGDLTGSVVTPLIPKLSPLGTYGGPTQTMALLAGSPALDAGSNVLAVDGSGNPLTTDQRGLPRIAGRAVDIGAFEAQPQALSGDVNHDGSVNFTDLLLLAQHYGSAAQPLWEGGDVTGDGSVSFADLLALAQNYGQSSSPALAIGILR